MRMTSTCGLGIAIVLSGAMHLQAAETATQPAATATTSPSATPVPAPLTPRDYWNEEQLVQAYRARQFAMLVKECARIRSVPTVLKHYDGFNLLVLNAEAALQIKNKPLAMQLFKNAAAATTDERKQAIMLATAQLVDVSRNFKYMPQSAQALVDPEVAAAAAATGGPGPAGIDLLNLGKRPLALRVLLIDGLSAANLRIERVSKEPLPAIDGAIKMLEELEVVEMASQGKVDETRKLDRKLGQQIGVATSARIQRLLKESQGIEEQAERVMPAATMSPRNTVGGIDMPQGLRQDQVDRLEKLMNQLDRVGKDLEKIAARLHLEPNFFDPAAKEAAEARTTVQGVLDREPTMVGVSRGR